MPRRYASPFVRTLWGTLSFLSVWALSAAPARGQNTVTLEGRVRTDEGRTIPSGVTVFLETGEGSVVGSRPASSDGQFQFDSLPKIHFRLIVTAEGFETAEQEVDLTQAANTAFADVFLSPLAKIKSNSSALPTLTDLNAPKKARKEYEKGARAFEDRNLREARTRFEKAVEVYPCYARAQTDLGLTLSVQHLPLPAESALHKALECDPGFLDAYAQFGQLLNAERKFAESERILAEGLRRSPNTWQFHFQLGAAYYGEGQYGKAEAEYQKTLALNPSPPPDFHVKLADLYSKTGAYDKAYAQMQDYLRADPNGRFVKRIKNVMQQMESSGMLHPAQAKATPPPKP